MDIKKTHEEKVQWEPHKKAVNKSWKQHPTKPRLYSYLPPISKTIQDEQDLWSTGWKAKTNS